MFQKPCNEDHRDDEEYPFLDCWDGKQEQFDALQQMDPWARNAPESCTRCERLPLSELPCLFCVSEVGSIPDVCQLKDSMTYISSEGEDRPDEIPIGVAPSDNFSDGEWWPDEVDLNAVTFGNMSIDSKPSATDGDRGRYREITFDSGAGESVVKPRPIGQTCRF